MENLNETVLSSDELKNEISNLQMEKNILTKKLDEVEQHLHETKRQLTTSKLMEEELLSELESFNAEKKSVEEQFNKKIILLEEEIQHLKKTDSDHMQHLENELKEKHTEIEDLKEKLNILSKENNDKMKDDIINKLNKQAYELNLKIDDLLYELNECRMCIEESSNKNVMLENKIIEYERNLEEMKEFLSIKKAELEASNERFQNLQEELILAQMELNKIKSVPLDKAQKGNSLFAEVEDNRQKLKQYIQIMNKKYSEMKASYNRKILEMQNLRSSYAVLKTTVNERCNFEDDQERIIESHKKNIEDMMENIQSLQKELELRKELTDNILNGRQKSTEALIEITRKEVVELREKLVSQTYSRMTSENALYTSQVELKKWRLEALSLRSEILILKQTIEELKNKTSTLSDMPNYEENDEIKKPSIVEIKKTEITEIPKKVLTEKNENSEINKLIIPNFEEKECYASKYKSTNFCKQRTLTVINDDSFIQLDNLQKNNSHNSPILSNTDKDFDISFETFDDDLQIYKNSSDNLIEKLEQEVKTTENKIKDKENVLEDKININKDINVKKLVDKSVKLNIVKESRKVSFSTDIVDSNASVPRKSKILVPKKVIRIPFTNSN